MPATRSSRRPRLAASALVTIAVGLLVSRLPDPLGDVGGTILYAVLVYLLVGVALPAARPTSVGALALASCWAIEIFQLTTFPERWASEVPVVAYVLGTSFTPLDLVGYAAGAGLAVLVDRGSTRSRTSDGTSIAARNHPIP